MPKATANAVQLFDLQGLREVWQNDATVWKVCREKNKLLANTDGKDVVLANRVNAVNNAAVLAPCLERMRLAGSKLPLPYLEPLQAELVDFFASVKIEPTDKLVYKTACELKRLLSFVKRRANKKDEGVTKVSRQT